jgi:hypothetical protein
MSGSDSQKLQDKIQEMVKLLEGGRGNREETAKLMAEAAERLGALETSNKRLREEARGPAQAAWSKFMGDAIKGHLAHEAIAFDFDELQWNSVIDNCEDIADMALIRWKMRWMDGVTPVRRPRRHRGDPPDPLPKAGEIAKPEEARAAAQKIEDIFAAMPRPGVRMVDAAMPIARPVAVTPTPAAVPPKPEPPVVPTTPIATPKAEPPHPAAVPRAAVPPPPPAATSASAPTQERPKERQPGDD